MSKIKVLLVDDEEDYVRTMAARMEMRDVLSRVALSGEEALHMVRDDAPDVMVLDLRMPGIDGMDVLERVRKEHPHVQVIILTGHGSEAEEEQARRLGAFDYLQKPTDTNRLLRTVRDAWRRALGVLEESKTRFEGSMAAAAFAEAGAPDLAAELLDAHTGEEEPETPSTTEPLKVLLVDDEEEFVTTIAERMGMRDLGSDVALSGEQALTMLEDEVPDVMVLDLRMPGLDGMEVLRKVRKSHPRVQVIIMTGHGSEEDEEQARALGAFAYLRKPVEVGALVDTIRAAGRAGRAGA
ncbi:MAG TPA: response regulator [Longimicrobiales bacterium]|jgi:DNA-binding NtrC family response regulator